MALLPDHPAVRAAGALPSLDLPSRIKPLVEAGIIADPAYYAFWEAVRKTLSDHDAFILGLPAYFAGVNAMLADHETRLDSLEAYVAGLPAYFAGLEAAIATINSRLAAAGIP